MSATWTQLSDQAEAQFGHRAARIYPYIFATRPLERRPSVRTHLGPARVISVVTQQGPAETYYMAEVVLDKELDRYRNHVGEGEAPKPRLYRVAPNLIKPPIAPPPSWAAQVYGVTA